jgi:hypothetical protein
MMNIIEDDITAIRIVSIVKLSGLELGYDRSRTIPDTVARNIKLAPIIIIIAFVISAVLVIPKIFLAYELAVDLLYTPNTTDITIPSTLPIITDHHRRSIYIIYNNL